MYKALSNTDRVFIKGLRTRYLTNNSHYYPNTSIGIKERTKSRDLNDAPPEPLQTPYPPFEDAKNPKTGEVGGPTGPEPTRFGDWERKGRVSDF